MNQQKEMQRIITGSCMDVIITPDGKQLLAANVRDQGITVWNIKSGKKEMMYDNPNKKVVTSMSVTSDGKTAVAGIGNTITAWDTKTGKVQWIQKTWDGSGSISRIVISKDNKTIAFYQQSRGLHFMKLD